MGFQTADVRTFARGLVSAAGVSGVWVLASPEDRGCLLWVAVRGLDDEGYTNRLAVRELIEAFIENRDDDIRWSHYDFDYRVSVDDPGLGELHVPAGAVPIDAA